VAETKAERFKIIAALSKTLDRKFETTNSLVRVGSKNIEPIPCIVTNLPTLDFDVFKFGGLPRGRLVELYGSESQGKTSLSLHIAGEEQKAGGVVVFIDAEHALDLSYAESLGVNVDELVLNQPNSGDEALHTADKLVEEAAATLIIVDSVAALVPEAELAGDVADAHVGQQSRLMSQACRILTGKCARSQTTILFINQLRTNIGVKYGDPSVTPGGRALKFYSSLRLCVSRKEAITEGTKDHIVGHQVDVRCVKCKGGVPFSRTVVDLIYPGEGRTPGFDKVNDMITYASNHGLFTMNGSWYSIDGERVANGLDNLKTYLKSEPKALVALQKKVKTFVENQAGEQALPVEKI
jgi:recombination protein RecA